MPINAHPEYIEAESNFHAADTDEERIAALEEMMKHMPGHKGAENLRKNIRTRYKKLKAETAKKAKKSGKKGIKKGEMQAILLGLTNSGKSSILKAITKAHPKIASYGFTTNHPLQGTLNFQGCTIQIIDMPPLASDNFDRSLVNSADTILIVVEKLHEIKTIQESFKKLNEKANLIIVFNKIDQYDPQTKRKIEATLKTKKYNYVLVSTKTDEGIDELKEKILDSFNVIRIFTRQPGSRQDSVPVIMNPNSTLKQVAEKVLHGFSKKVKYAKITGPSSKFKGQRVGLKHKVKDRDVVEFFTE